MVRKIRNLIGALLLVTAIVVTQIPVTDVEAVSTASASDFQMDGTTLVKYNGTAEDVSISNYVKKIESEAFAGNDSVKTVKIGDSVREIGSRAFADCVNLQSVEIPDSVELIDGAAFSGCPLLSKLSVGKGLKTLGNGVFAGAYSLKDVSIDSSNPKFTCNDGAIYNKDGLDTLYQVLAGRAGDSYSMPSTVKTIKPYAFWGDYNLREINVGSNVKEIPGYCFSNCKNVKTVTIPYSVNRIDMKAFEDCVRLREIEIPPSVNTIHATAFDGCTKLDIQAEEGSYAQEFAKTLELKDIDVSEYEEAPIPGNDSLSDNSTEQSADGEAADTTPVDYYHEVTHMNPMEDETDTNVKGITRIIGQQAFVMIDNASATINVGSTGETIGGEPEKTAIPAQAYYDDPMTAATFPENTQRIGEFSFARSGLTKVTIPDGVEEIGYGAFYHCDDLAEVSIPSSVKSVESFAFAKTPWLEGWLSNVGGGSDFQIVGDGILLAYRGNSPQVEIPQEVRQIGPDAFREHTEITQVTIPDSVEIIGEAAFMDCSALTSVQGMNGTKEIRDRAFAGCPIQNIHIPASVTEIGLRAFDVAESGKPAENGVVVFEGNTLPALAYGTAATKLYHDSYRGYALNGNSIAVVPDGVSAQDRGKGSVLEPGKLGFDGSVCKVVSEPDTENGQPGALQVLWNCSSQDPVGKTFYLDGVPYEVQAGENGSDTENLVQEQAEENPQVTVEAQSAHLPEDGQYQAAIEGIEKSYMLKITDSETAKTEIQKVYQSLSEGELPGTLQGYEFQLTENSSGIPITSLGRQTMSLAMPIPDGIDPNSVHVLCLNTDGLLKEVESHIMAVDGIDSLTFDAKHFPYYAIYSDQTDENVIAEGPVELSEGRMVFDAQGAREDGTLKPGIGTFVKWTAAGVLFSGAMAAFFLTDKIWKKRRRA